jgi:hypothetical protein
MEDLKYPIGKYIPKPYSAEQLEEWLLDLEVLPKALEFAIQNLDAAQLEKPYREGGWNSRQVVHHVADSHMNAYMRLKLGYTENNPAIKPYEENDWAVLADVKEVPINVSITLLYALHSRLVNFLKSFTASDWDKTVYHPEHKKEMTLWFLLGMYAWHGKHHTAHINNLRTKMNW